MNRLYLSDRRDSGEFWGGGTDREQDLTHAEKQVADVCDEQHGPPTAGSSLRPPLISNSINTTYYVWETTPVNLK